MRGNAVISATDFAASRGIAEGFRHIHAMDVWTSIAFCSECCPCSRAAAMKRGKIPGISLPSAARRAQHRRIDAITHASHDTQSLRTPHPDECAHVARALPRAAHARRRATRAGAIRSTCLIARNCAAHAAAIPRRDRHTAWCRRSPAGTRTGAQKRRRRAAGTPSLRPCAGCRAAAALSDLRSPTARHRHPDRAGCPCRPAGWTA